MKLLFSLTICFLLISSCSNKDGNSLSAQKEISQNIFSDSISNFNVLVFYETGAEPYVGNIGLTTNQTWDIAESSYTSLFQNHSGRSINVPKTLGEMTEIDDQNKSSWTSDELINLGRSIVPGLLSENTVKIPIIFLNGLYEGNSGILGIQISGYYFAFVFKDVVSGVGGDATTQRYVEQATVVHEIGHAIGLVNNGVPLSSNHEDSSHPKHTQNDECVMYWAVESTTDILSFLTGFISGGKLNLFGQESLQDGQGYHP